jgi:hypothetical protein
MGMIPHILGRLLEVAEAVPRLYDALPWLRDMSVEALITERYASALFSNSLAFSDLSDQDQPSSEPEPEPDQEATLASFFREVTGPIAEMIETLYLSPLLRERHMVWEIGGRMARSSGAKALPEDVVTGVCASILRERAAVLRKGLQPRSAIWKVTWRPTPVWIRWPHQLLPLDPTKNSFVAVVTEETTSEGARAPRGGRVGEDGKEGEVGEKVLAFRCTPGTGICDTCGVVDIEALETAMEMALYDALVFPLSAEGQFVWPPWHISPPTHLYVQAPMPKAIRQAASVWRIKVEEIIQTREGEQQEAQPGSQPGSQRRKDWQCNWEQGWEWEKWEKDLTGRVLDPVQYLRILDRVCERAYGNAPFLAKQQVVRHLGWHMLPEHDPLMHCPGLGELLPSYPAVVGEDGSVGWNGWHYRDYDEDLLRYFPGSRVTIRPSPLAEAAVLVYWRGSVLCYAVAEELRHEDGSYRPYWFPYPRLGE